MMFARHVTSQLSAYILGELTPAKADGIERHLARCPRCRAVLAEVRFSTSLLRGMPGASAPQGLWEKIEARLPDAREDVPHGAAWRLRLDGGAVFTLAGCLLLVVLVISGWRHSIGTGPDRRPAWVVTRLAGAPLVDRKPISQHDLLRVGEWLETDDRSRARLQVVDIGEVEIEPNSQIRLVRSRTNEHRLSLRRGILKATVTAPPRLFFVETPSAVAVDLGCAYTLAVDANGASHLRVTAGYVALTHEGSETIVPAGASCRARSEGRLDAPVFDDAPAPLIRALDQMDGGQNDGVALGIVLRHARRRDSLTLWHLLRQTDGDARVRVYDRLTALAPPPAGVRREDVMRLTPSALERWRPSIEATWIDGATLEQPWWLRYMTQPGGGPKPTVKKG